jgi:hypothetical protein
VVPGMRAFRRVMFLLALVAVFALLAAILASVVFS